MTADSIERVLLERATKNNIAVPSALVPRLLEYYGILARWNERMNLTSLKDPEQAVDRLLLEPLKAAQHVRPGLTIIDLGSGGGSPAIPLALASGARSLVMIESKARKAAFLREAVRHVGIQATVECARFEEVLPKKPRFADLVTMRAVRVDKGVLDLIGPVLTSPGEVLLFVARMADVDVPESFSVDRVVSLPGTSGGEAAFLKARVNVSRGTPNRDRA